MTWRRWPAEPGCFPNRSPASPRWWNLASLGWEPLTVDAEGLHIAATCTIAALSRFVAPPEWQGADLIGLCCEALLGSFKVWNAATVGGNICLALPAGPMTALAASLGGIATIWGPDGGERSLPVVDLVTGDHRTSLAPGEILRAACCCRCRRCASASPSAACRSPRSAARASCSSARADRNGVTTLTLTAATTRPIRLVFSTPPAPDAVAGRIDAEVSLPGLWHDDIHGDPAWRRHVSLLFAEEIRRELMEA